VLLIYAESITPAAMTSLNWPWRRYTAGFHSFRWLSGQSMGFRDRYFHSFAQTIRGASIFPSGREATQIKAHFAIHSCNVS
jgi:hypothetical protein